MKNFQKGSVDSGLIIIIVILVIVVGYFAFLKKPSESQQSNSLPQPTNNDVSNNSQTQTTSNQTVSVRVSISGMNEPVFALAGDTTILGQKYLYVRNADTIVKTIDPGSLSIGDSCGDVVNAQFEIANPKVEIGRMTFRGDSTVSVDVVRVISHETPQRSCAN